MAKTLQQKRYFGACKIRWVIVSSHCTSSKTTAPGQVYLLSLLAKTFIVWMDHVGDFEEYRFVRVSKCMQHVVRP